MSIRAIPLIVIAFILYNIVILMGGGIGALDSTIFNMKLLSGGVWNFKVSDMLILITLILLFIEMMKSTYTTASTLIDHGLSMLVFIACGIEFLTVPQAATSVFFLIMAATLIDVVGGYTIGIRVAKRNLDIGPISRPCQKMKIFDSGRVFTGRFRICHAASGWWFRCY